MSEFCRKHLEEVMGISADEFPAWCCEEFEGLCDVCGLTYLNKKVLPAKVGFLLPCPFCGGVDVRLAVTITNGVTCVVCLNLACEATGPLKGSGVDALNAWNKRSGGVVCD